MFQWIDSGGKLWSTTRLVRYLSVSQHDFGSRDVLIGGVSPA
jgi:hypothetical protein